jgi:hypothetical protein
MAVNRSVLNTQQPCEAGGGDREPLPVPKLKWQLFKGEANDISVGESERVITTVVRADSYQRLGTVVLADVEWAGVHSRHLVAAPEEDGEAIPGGAGSKAHRGVSQLLV